MAFYKDVVDAIGNTPLIKLRGPSELTGCNILGKAEWLNPGMSVKDRAAAFTDESTSAPPDGSGPMGSLLKSGPLKRGGTGMLSAVFTLRQKI